MNWLSWLFRSDDMVLTEWTPARAAEKERAMNRYLGIGDEHHSTWPRAFRKQAKRQRQVRAKKVTRFPKRRTA